LSEQRLNIEKEVADNIFLLLETFRKDPRLSVLSTLLESGQLELILSVGLVTNCNKRFR
jgi:hypothetical protein